jgi:cob(I)alamin adenosyltransferase
MKIYTRTGDTGETGLFGGARVSKADMRVAAYGDVDELNSVIGVARAAGLDASVDGLLARVQLELFDLGAELATVPEKIDKLDLPRIEEEEVERLETAIDRFEADLAPLKTFILPGGCGAAAQLHVARCVCRRAERGVVALASESTVRPEVVHYLNRLSDLLFTLARQANHRVGVADVPWLGRDR